VVGPKIGVRVFGCYGPSELKLALRFRFRISPLRRGFLVSGPWCVLRWVGARRIGKWLVCLLVLVLVLSLTRVVGNTGQTRWSRHRIHATCARSAEQISGVWPLRGA
jgi:hypothetical protein